MPITLVSRKQFLGAQWNCNPSLAFRTEEKSPPLSLFWKECLPGGKALGRHKQDCQTESHLFIPQLPKCLWFFKKIIDCAQHANPVTRFCLKSHHHPLRKLGSEKKTPSSYPASQGTLESSPTCLQIQIPAVAASATAPLLLQAGSH